MYDYKQAARIMNSPARRHYKNNKSQLEQDRRLEEMIRPSAASSEEYALNITHTDAMNTKRQVRKFKNCEGKVYRAYELNLHDLYKRAKKFAQETNKELNTLRALIKNRHDNKNARRDVHEQIKNVRYARHAAKTADDAYNYTKRLLPK